MIATILAAAPAGAAMASTPFVAIFTVFVLAIFVGYYVVWGVTPALHTPLMAVTNALSSIVIVGAILQTVVILAGARMSMQESAGLRMSIQERMSKRFVIS